MKLRTYLNFDGTCAAAFRYYEQVLGAKPGMSLTFGQVPAAQAPPEWKDHVLHARITLGDGEIMGADIPNAEPTRSSYLSLSVDSDAEAERIYRALADGGEPLMPMQETFFASRFGQVRDRFGVSWMILHERPTQTNT